MKVGRYSSIARRTSVTVAAIGFNSFIRPIITSGSFKPCPVTVQTIRLPSRISRNEYAASFESHHLKRPAIDAALAGSTKIPSCCASHLCAAKISSSVTTSIAPRDSTMAAQRLVPTGRISDSNRRGDRFRLVDYAVVKNRRRAGRLEANHRRQFC